jgi:hypothetical protein
MTALRGWQQEKATEASPALSFRGPCGRAAEPDAAQLEHPMIVRTPWTSPPTWDGLSYRIWMRKTPFGIFQRHEWRKADGRESIDGWIPSYGRKLPTSGYEPVEGVVDVADLVAALERIAAGDNDARATAAAVLAAWRETA